MRLLLCLIVMLPGLALAQNPFAPAILVNNQVITNYDLDQRVRLLRAFGQSGDLEEVATDQLIEERLQLQAAFEAGLDLTEERVEGAVASFAERQGLTAEQIEAVLRGVGADRQALADFVTVRAAWQGLVELRFRSQAQPSERDLDAALSIVSSSAGEQVQLREIAIPFAERGQAASLALAERITREVNAGQRNFAATARQVSRTASAARGGLIDPIPLSNLAPQLAAEVLPLQPGQASDPIPLPNGVTVLQLVSIDPIDDARQRRVAVSYGRLLFPLASAGQDGIAEARGRALAVADRLDSCGDLEAFATEYPEGSGLVPAVDLAEVPGDVAMSLAKLDPTEISAEVIEGGALVLLMLCERSVELSPDTREALRQRIYTQRLASFGEGFLQDLKRNAVIVTP